MEFGKAYIGSCIFKAYIIHIVMVDIGDKALELIEVLSLLIIREIDASRLVLLSGYYAEYFEKPSEDGDLADLGRLAEIDIGHLKEDLMYLPVVIRMSHRVDELGLGQEILQVGIVVEPLHELYLEQIDKTLALGITLDLVHNVRRYYQDITGVQEELAAVGCIFIAVLDRNYYLERGVPVQRIPFDLIVIPDPQVALGNGINVFYSVGKGPFYELPYRLFIV